MTMLRKLTLTLILILPLSLSAQDFDACHAKLKEYSYDWDPLRSIGSEFATPSSPGKPKKPWYFPAKNKERNSATTLSFFLRYTGFNGMNNQRRANEDSQSIQRAYARNEDLAATPRMNYSFEPSETTLDHTRCFNKSMMANYGIPTLTQEQVKYYGDLLAERYEVKTKRDAQSRRILEVQLLRRVIRCDKAERWPPFRSYDDVESVSGGRSKPALKMEKAHEPDKLQFEYRDNKCYISSVSGNSRFDYRSCYKLQELIKLSRHPREVLNVNDGHERYRWIKSLIKEELGETAIIDQQSPTGSDLRTAVISAKPQLDRVMSQLCSLYQEEGYIDLDAPEETPRTLPTPKEGGGSSAQ